MDDIERGYLQHVKHQLQTIQQQRDALLAALHELAQDRRENDPRRLRALHKAHALVAYMKRRL